MRGVKTMKKWSKPQIKNLSIVCTNSNSCASFEQNPNPVTYSSRKMPDWVANLGCIHCLHFGFDAFKEWCLIYNNPELDHGCETDSPSA